MKKFYLFAAAAVLLAACVKTQSVDELALIDADKTAVSFDVYTPRATKAGKPHVITTDTLKRTTGFGVFAYYTNNGTYGQYVKPNFMYNQQVTYNSTKEAWTYEPVKYWPNETGNAAKSDDKDYVTFFAYAPYVKSVVSTGAVEGDQQKNITGMISNTTMGDPKIKYVVDWDPNTSVDLLWGVQSKGEKAGLPFVDQIKPLKADTTTSFNLKHALAKLNVQIKAFGDEDLEQYGHGVIDGKTKIYVRSITFEGFASKGTLNLNNTKADTPLWMDYAGIDNLVAEPVTIFDGRKDGKEGYQDGDATNENVIGLNHDIIQCKEATPGVVHEYVNLFKPFSSEGVTDPIFVIPNGEAMKVTIVYDVETEDNKLAGYLSDGKTHGSTIENTITRDITIDNTTSVESVKMSAGKAYTIKIHLCVTTVKVEAEVQAWGEGADTQVLLPASNS